MKNKKINIKRSLPTIQSKYHLIDEVGKELNPNIEISTIQLKSILKDVNTSKDDLIEYCLIIWHRYQHTKKELEKIILKNAVAIEEISKQDKKSEFNALAKVTGRLDAFEPNREQAKQVIQNIESENKRPIEQADWRKFKLRMEKIVPEVIPSNRKESANDKEGETIGFALSTIRNLWEELTGLPPRQK
jgi:hypothetical protein